MRTALGLLPFLAFLATGLAFYTRQCRGGEAERPSIRNTLLQAAAFCGLWLVVGTELFSALTMLAFWPILIWWLIPLLVSLGNAIKNIGKVRLPPRPRKLTIPELVVLALLVWFTGLALTAAVFSPPNNYDSYSYHLPRQVMWIQQESVRDYSTDNLRQLIMPPFAEFVGLHV